ncbi:hypothetical protein [Pedobacter aquatilis]|uniref:hypothetical protein n=1 Tax=Pedobacter aquatilis TaxID=351343 RepID=UPI00292EA526|nr:hypothetical protein [Pedobacter aquatilis]
MSEKYSFSYSKIVLIGLAFLYFILPVTLQSLVGEDFYIFSKYQFLVSDRSILFFILLIILLSFLAKKIKKTAIGLKIHPSKGILILAVSLNFVYLLIVLIRGILLRQQGLAREDLLGIISSQLIPGYGYFLLLSFVALLQLKEKKFLFLFILIAFGIDIIYQGKIFVTNALMLSMFYIDNIKLKFSLLRISLIGLSGLAFLVVIFVIRSIATDGEAGDLTSVYTSFSEFMGVNATVGWSYEFNKQGMPASYFNYDPVLQKYYLSSVGHGLAISPVAYFTGNFGDSYLVAIIAYFLIIYLIFYYSSKIIGRYAFFVLMYNFIHLLRHGPDIFLYKCILQIMFLIVVIAILKSFEKKLVKA